MNQMNLCFIIVLYDTCIIHCDSFLDPWEETVLDCKLYPHTKVLTTLPCGGCQCFHLNSIYTMTNGKTHHQGH